MEAITNMSERDILSLLGLALVIVLVCLRIRELHRGRFTYYEATIWSAYSADSSGLEKVASGKVVREGKDGEWQFRYNGTWRYLKNKQLIGVRESIASNKPIVVYVG